MSRTEWFAPKWLWLRRFAPVALVGVVAATLGVFISLPTLVAIGALLLVPLVFWLALIPVLHWKDRYIGNTSTVWGAFLVFETSSWSKIFYWFIHVLPDWRRSKQYANAP
ncbi:MAG TPA: hypothetical protein VFP88_07725 [Rhodanobacteraceae bacterium]|nr:hypothetical protein [Rhodanobacteraceae bacterium]